MTPLSIISPQKVSNFLFAASVVSIAKCPSDIITIIFGKYEIIRTAVYNNKTKLFYKLLA